MHKELNDFKADFNKWVEEKEKKKDKEEMKGKQGLAREKEKLVQEKREMDKQLVKGLEREKQLKKGNKRML